MPKKILLIEPPFQRFMNFSKQGIPIGLLSIAGSLKDRGHDVRVFDADYNPTGKSYPFIEKIEHYSNYLEGLHDDNHFIWQELFQIIGEYMPDMVGISMMSTKVKSGLRVANIAKKCGVERVVVGGPHVTMSSEEILSQENVDGVGLGEAELNFEELFSSPRISSSRIKDLDLLPPISRESLINIENYKPEDLGYLMTERGCANSCNFCCSNVLWGKAIRKRSLDKVFQEIDEVNSSYGTEKFYNVADTFTLNKSRVREFGTRMKQRNLHWSCLTRMDKFDGELIEHMLGSNCDMIKVGVESGNERILKSMNKGISLNTIENSAKILNERGMPWLAYFIIGSPEETPEEMYDTMKFIGKISPTYISPQVYTPYPGTGFEQKNDSSRDFAMEEINHHSLERVVGKVPKEELRKFMEFADGYNNNSEGARKLFHC
jgi:radical SAM superfamily enzyme YgiQ (UPF0313 family)